MKGSLLFLGTGSSTGIPLIGCTCPTCTSANPKNKRLRPSVLIRVNGKQLLMDAGPDFRMQALTHQIMQLDGVILTHTHFDHVGGIDELRVYYFRTHQSLPILSSLASLEELKKRYDYLFVEKSFGESLCAKLHFYILEGERGEISFCDVPLSYMSYEQGGTVVTGYRFGHLAYLTDVKNYPPSLFQDLEGVETIIVNALRETPSPMHLSLEEAIDFVRRSGAKRGIFTHIGHEMDHATENKLPPGFSFAYDGLALPFTID